MGAKLSKKKKGYCLGAGKDGESTETTEVEQKETETQAGQKDAAEPNGKTPPNDQTLNNGASEEQKAHAEKNSTEVPSDETTKDDSKKDQKSENKPSAEQKQVEESNKQQEKLEHAESSNVSPQVAKEGEKEVKTEPKEKEQTVHDKEKELVGKDEPNQAPTPVIEQDHSESKQPDQSVTKPSAPVPDQEEVAKSLPDSETKVDVEKVEKEQTPVPTPEHLSTEATKPPTPVTESVKEPEKPELVEPLVLETASVAPVLQEPVSAPVVELVEPELTNKAEPETTEESLPETQPAPELVKPESELVTQSVTMTESLESKVSEGLTASVPEVKSVEPVANPEVVPCPEPEKLNETKEDTQSVPEPLPSNEVPDLTAQVEENVKNSEILDNDLVKESLETQAATTESAPAEQPSADKVPDQDATVLENGPTEQAVEEMQENKAQDTICTVQEVKDKEMQNDKEEEIISEKQPTEHGCLEKGEDCKDTEEVALDTSKNDQAAPEDPTVNEATQDAKNPEAENHEMPADEISREPSSLLIVDKHGVTNGLPLKEEVKELLENGCDKGLHELNGQGESHEIEVCNE